MNEEKLHLDQDRAEQAKLLLENEMLQKVLSDIEASVLDKWENAPAADLSGKDYLWQLYKTSKRFNSILHGYIETGKLATSNLEPPNQTLTQKIRRII